MSFRGVASQHDSRVQNNNKRCLLNFFCHLLGFVVDSKHAQQIKNHWISLSKVLDCDNGLISELLARGIIDINDKSSLEAENNFVKCNEILLQMMQQKSSQDFQQFCAALEATNQPHVVELIFADQEAGKLLLLQ
jgi:hypothetical protein